MPFRDKEREREHRREYYAKNREAKLEYGREYHAQNREAILGKQRRYYAENREAMRETMRRYRAENPEVIREQRRLKNYSLTPEGFAAMMDAQEGRCGICANALVLGRGGASVDHCHATGETRALLCGPCNTMLGQAKDSPETLRAGARYIELHKNKSIIERIA